MAEDLISTYERGMPEEQKRSVMVSFRLRPADAAALLGTSAISEVSLSSVARLAALERIELHRKNAKKDAEVVLVRASRDTT